MNVYQTTIEAIENLSDITHVYLEGNHINTNWQWWDPKKIQPPKTYFIGTKGENKQWTGYDDVPYNWTEFYANNLKPWYNSHPNARVLVRTDEKIPDNGIPLQQNEPQNYNEPRIFTATEPWSEKGPQDRALEYAEMSEGIVFAFDNEKKQRDDKGKKQRDENVQKQKERKQKKGKGTKGYLVVKNVHELKQQLPVKRSFRNFYQLIPTHREVGLYLDIEYDKELNPQLTEDDVLKSVWSYISEKWPIVTPENTVLLTASGEKKASFHKNCNQQIFQSNHIDLKNQMMSLKKKIDQEYENKIPRALFMKCKKLDKDGVEELVHVIDFGVYTPHRVWRLGGQCKQSEPNRPLKWHPSNKYQPDPCIITSSMIFVGRETAEQEGQSSKRKRGKGDESTRERKERTVNSSTEIPTRWRWAVAKAVETVRERNPHARISKTEYDPTKHRIYLSFQDAHQCWYRDEKDPHKSNNMFVFFYLIPCMLHLKCHDCSDDDELDKRTTIITLTKPEYSHQQDEEEVDVSDVDEEMGGLGPWQLPLLSQYETSMNQAELQTTDSVFSEAMDCDYDGEECDVPVEQEMQAQDNNAVLNEIPDAFVDQSMSVIAASYFAAENIPDIGLQNVHRQSMEVLEHSPDRLHQKEINRIRKLFPDEKFADMIPIIVRIIDQHYKLSNGWEVDDLWYSENDAINFLVVNNKCQRPKCPIYERMNYSKVKQGGAFEHTISIAHDIVRHLQTEWAVRCHVTCGCVHGRGEKTAKCNHDWTFLTTQCVTTETECVGKLHFDAIRRDAMKKLIPSEHHHLCESGLIELKVFDQQYIPTLERRYEGDIYIKSPTGSGKSDFIKSQAFPLFLVRQCLDMFQFRNEEERAVYCTELTEVQPFETQKLTLANLMLMPWTLCDHSDLLHEPIDWFEQVILQDILQLRILSRGVVDINSLVNIRTECKGVFDENVAEISTLFISPLITLADKWTRDYGAVSYSSFFAAGGTRAQFAKFPRAICSVESIQKCVRWKYKDCVFDEWETTSPRFSSETVGTGRIRREKIAQLFHYCKQADRVLCADQNLSKSTLRFLLNKRPPTSKRLPTKIWYNVYKGSRPEINLLQKKDDLFALLQYFAVYNSGATAGNIIPLVIPVNYTGIGDQVVECIKRYDMSITESQILYVWQQNKNDPRQKKAIEKPTEEWVKYRYVIYSPTIQAGLDHNPLEPHFGVLIGYFGHGNCGSAENFIQMLGRSRKLRFNTVFVFAEGALSQEGKVKESINKEEILKLTIENAEIETNLREVITDSIPFLEPESQLLEMRPDYDTDEMGICLHNLVIGRKTRNNPHDRLVYLLKRAGHSIREIYSEDLVTVASDFLMLNGFIPNDKMKLEKVSTSKKKKEAEELEKKIKEVLAVTLTEEEERIFEQRIQRQTIINNNDIKMVRFQVQRILATRDPQLLEKDIKFGLSFHASSKTNIFKLLAHYSESITPCMLSTDDFERNIYEFLRENPMLVRDIAQQILKISGFQSICDEFHVVCSSLLQQMDAVAKMKQLFATIPLDNIKELSLLFGCKSKLNITNEIDIIEFLKPLFKACGLQLSIMPGNQGCDNKGYRLETSSLKCMVSIYERTAEKRASQASTSDIFEPWRMDNLTLPTSWEGMFLPENIQYYNFLEGTTLGDVLYESWHYSTKPTGFEMSSMNGDGTKLIAVVAHKNIFIWMDSKPERCSDHIQLLDRCRDHFGTMKNIRYRLFCNTPDMRNESKGRLLQLISAVQREKKEKPKKIETDKDSHVVVVDKRWFGNENEDIESLLETYRDERTGRMIGWPARYWKRTYSFKQCDCEKGCKKKCKRSSRGLVCLNTKVLSLTGF